MEKYEGRKGVIKIEFTAWCATCLNWERVTTAANKRRSAFLFRKMGWQYTRRMGWVCPHCVAKERG